MDHAPRGERELQREMAGPGCHDVDLQRNQRHAEMCETHVSKLSQRTGQVPRERKVVTADDQVDNPF